jgi:3-hydroxyacyl-[acyl-carrier-protein] dehydratase
LPNRPSAVRLVRSVTWLRADESAQGQGVRASFAMPADHPIALGHYPGRPIVPGTCLLEAALQAIECAPRGEWPGVGALIRIEDLQLMHAAQPSETIELHAAPAAEAATEPELAGAWRWRVTFTHAGRKIARATLLIGTVSADPDGTAPALVPTPEWTQLSALDIARSLPHRGPMLLVDGAWVAPGGEHLVATRTVTLADSCYSLLSDQPGADELGYPSLMVAEGLAQAAGMLQMGADRGGPVVMLLGGARRLEFHAVAQPGECLRHELNLRRRFGDTSMVSGATFAGGRLIARMHDLLVTVKKQAAPTGHAPAAATTATPLASTASQQTPGALHHAS